MRYIMGWRSGWWFDVVPGSVIDPLDVGHCLTLEVPSDASEEAIEESVIQAFDALDQERLDRLYAETMAIAA